MVQRVAAVMALLAWVSVTARAQDNALREAARLDEEQKCGEAERLYQQALAKGSPSLSLLNSLGNHYLLCGDADKARSYFERVIKLNPRHPNANLQLARLAVDRHQGTPALEYLSRVSDQQPEVRLLRVEALYWAGKKTEALATLDSVGKEIGGDAPGLSLRADVRQNRRL